jgi:AhpD family alkylhydroperoxidase
MTTPVDPAAPPAVIAMPLLVPPTAARGPVLTAEALRRWLPAMACRTPDLITAYVMPGRIPPRLREAAMLGVTSVNRCAACTRVHERWATAVGLDARDPLGFSPPEAAAYAFGQALAREGPRVAIPQAGLPARHRRELRAVATAMELANLAGNRFLPRRGPGDRV